MPNALRGIFYAKKKKPTEHKSPIGMANSHQSILNKFTHAEFCAC